VIWGILTSMREGALKLFAATGRPGESFAEREAVEHYGFTSRPLPGAEVVLIADGNNIVMIASDDRRYRIAVEAGEVALYTDEGDKVHLKRGREIEVVAGTKVKVTAPTVEIQGDLVVSGNVSDSAGTMAAMRTAYNGHTHPDPQGGATGAPVPGM
jgi:phage gp45-like